MAQIAENANCTPAAVPNRALLGGACDGVILHDLEGRILKANAALSERLGYPGEDLLHMGIADICDYQTATEYSKHLEDVRRRGRTVCKTTYLRRDGSPLPVEVSSRLIDDAGRQFVLSISRDITERGQHEEALCGSEQTFRAVIEQFGEGFLLIDKRGVITEWNQAMEQITGLRQEQAVGRASWDVLGELAAPEVGSDDLRERTKAIVIDALKKGESPYFGQVIEAAIIRSDGEKRHIQEIVFPVRAGGRLSIGHVIRDVSDRKRLEEDLAAREEHFRALIENSLDLICVVDSAGIMRYQSPSSERMLGYRPEELVGQEVFAFVNPDDLGGSREAFAGLLRDQYDSSRSTELRFRRKDGSWSVLDVMAKRLVNHVGEVSCVFNSRDITERKQAEEALRQSEEQLRQAQKMEAVGQLAGGMAHDFNNLLTSIIGNSSLVLGCMAPEDPNRELIADVQEVGERAAALTRQILAFSRRQVLKPEILCLNKVILDLEPLLRRTLGEDVELQLLLAPDLRQSEIDAQQMGQVLLNLALNARDAMPEGGRLLIETTNVSLDRMHSLKHREVRAGDYVTLAISDTGCGMDPETQARIFEPFFTTKEVGKGTGLGLSTAFGIVRQSGGSISVHSEPGGGSTFTVYLPATENLAVPLAASADRQEESGRGFERVLVVEDEAHVRELVVRLLSRSGYRVMAAGSAEEAEEALKSTGFDPDLMLTDVVLPGGVNGRQLAEALLKRFPHLRVLFMSGYTSNAVVHDGRLDPGVAFLEKPFTQVTLLAKVREVLDREVNRARMSAIYESG